MSCDLLFLLAKKEQSGDLRPVRHRELEWLHSDNVDLALGAKLQPL